MIDNLDPSADETTETAGAPEPRANKYSDLAKMISDGIAQGITAAQPKKLTYGQYQRKQPKLPKLLRPTSQNGYPVQNLTAAEITLCNRITHSGRYMDRRVEVILKVEGNDETLELRYPNKTTDQRFEMKSYFRNFEDLVRQIVEVQELEDAETAPLPSTSDTERPAGTKPPRQRRAS